MEAVQENVKHTFKNNGEPLAPKHLSELFPNCKLVGNLEEGLVVFDVQGNLVASVRSPQLNPVIVDEAGVVEFGAETLMSQVEYSMGRAIPESQVRGNAAQIIGILHRDGVSGVFGERGGALGIGMEEETWTYLNGNGGRIDLSPIPPELQHELQDSLWEVVTSPFASSRERVVALAELRLGFDSDMICNSTSVPMGGTLEGARINSGQHHWYVLAVTEYLYASCQTCLDENARQIWDQLAQVNGYLGFQDMVAGHGDLSFWVSSALHASLGLTNWESEGGYVVSYRELVAVSDLFNSDLATVAEWMTYSTPLLLGNRFGIQGSDGEMIFPRDMRAVVKYIMDTTLEAGFVGSIEEFVRRVEAGIISGLTHTVDRAPYITDAGAPACHSRVRSRMSQGNDSTLSSPIGRVEFTGGGETPDIIAVATRNAFLQLLGIAAYEALAEGSMPIDYFGEKFPLLGSCGRHKHLAHAYNFQVNENPDVQEVIRQTEAFLDYMEEKYRHSVIRELIALAQIGVQRLQQQTIAGDLDEFLQKPQGSVSDVIVRMYESGRTPDEIVVAVHHFQKAQAEILVQYDGDVLQFWRDNVGGF